MADGIILKDGEPFWDGMPGASHRHNLCEMYAVWQQALEEAVGPQGWSPAFGVTSDGARRVLQIVDWVGGAGEKPTITGYVGASGIVPDVASAVDIRGATGATGVKGDTGDTGPQGPKGDTGDAGPQGPMGPANTLTIGTVEDGETADAEIVGDAPNQTLNLVLPKGEKGDIGEQGPKGDTGSTGPKGDPGEKGDPGDDGWTPVMAAASDGERRVIEILDWTGGQGTKPSTGYLGATGVVSDIAQAIDVRGAPGSGAVSSVNTVEPDGNGNVDLGIADIPGLEDALDNAGQVKTVAGKGPDSNGDVALVKGDVGLGNVDNVSAANLRDRSTHTGTQSASTITGLATVATTGSYNDLDDKPTIPAGTVTSVGLSAPTGLSVSGSPVTGSGTLALTFASGYSLPTTAKQGQWDQAYGWGNHASAGYALSSSLAAVATSGSYNDLSNKPTIPTLAPIADTADIASLSGADTITPGSLGTAAAAAGTISGGASITFDWSAAVNYTMALTGNRTLPNPTNVLPGTTRVIVVSSSTSTTRTLAFGSNFVGDLPTVSVTNTSNMVLFLYAVSATKIVVSGVAI